MIRIELFSVDGGSAKQAPLEKEAREKNDLREVNLPDRDDPASGDLPADDVQPSGPVPFADLSAANAVIDEERAENARLREENTKLQKWLEARERDYQNSHGSRLAAEKERDKLSREVADRGIAIAVLGVILIVALGVCALMLSLVPDLGAPKTIKQTAAPISQENPTDRFYSSSQQSELSDIALIREEPGFKVANHIWGPAVVNDWLFRKYQEDPVTFTSVVLADLRRLRQQIDEERWYWLSPPVSKNGKKRDY